LIPPHASRWRVIRAIVSQPYDALAYRVEVVEIVEDEEAGEAALLA
jgi:hypothetical protein